MKVIIVDVEGIIGTQRIHIAPDPKAPSIQGIIEAKEQAVIEYNRLLEEGKQKTKAGLITEYDVYPVKERKHE